MQKVADAIYDEIDDLYRKTDILLGMWMRSVAEREFNRNYSDDNNRESTHYELQIDFTGISFRIRWIEFQFVKSGSKTLRLTKAINAPENGTHKLSQFKKAEQWELRLIEQLEPAFGTIRHQLKYLAKAHNSIVWAAKVNKTPLEVKQIKDRVERSHRSIKSIKESMKSSMDAFEVS
ncbi:conjugative transfer protein MobI(A/C) [Vibrio alginolyticus]|uniref:conjugative transfer protein MobI(A/C) n=1 Tax=Vibrio alginolyticus TaxID=663 RepID=UPI003754DF8E